MLQGGTSTSPTAQKMKTQSSKAVSSSGQGTREILEKSDVLTREGDTILTDIPSDQAKDQTETFKKKGEEGPLFTPYESTIDAA